MAGSGTKEAKAFYREGNPVLSQATVVQAILAMICLNKKEEEIGRHKKREYFLENPDRSLAFRKYYGRNEDTRIIRIIYSYFTAVKNTFKFNENSLWEFEMGDTRKPTNILQTTIGFIALLEILKVMLRNIKEEDNDKIETYENLLKLARSLDFVDDNNPKKYPFANKTKNLLYNDIGSKIWGVTFEKKKVLD